MIIAFQEASDEEFLYVVVYSETRSTYTMEHFFGFFQKRKALSYNLEQSSPQVKGTRLASPESEYANASRVVKRFGKLEN